MIKGSVEPQRLRLGGGLSKLLRVAAALAFAVGAPLVSANAHAQAQQVVAISGAEAIAGEPSLHAAPRENDADEPDRNPMAPAGVGVKLGFASIGGSAVSVTKKGKTFASQLDDRRGMLVSVPVHLGGSGFGWTIEPYLSRSSIGHEVTDQNGALVDEKHVDLTAFGLYTGPAVNIHVATPLYLGIGAGVKGAYLATDGFDYAFDVYGRAPLSATYYVTNQLALVAEFGLGFGASVYADPPRLQVDPVTKRVRNVSGSPHVGSAFAWDCSFGIRLP